MSDSDTVDTGCYWTFLWLAKQVSKMLGESMSYGENMDNFTALYASYLRFTFGTDSSPRAYRIFVFLLAVFYKFMPFKFPIKDVVGIIDHVQNA